MLGRIAKTDAQDTTEQKGFDAYEMRLGDVMRGERATLGKSLLDVQRELKIKAAYVAAIENADPSVFESPGFIAGYVRSYARYLGMDPEWAFERFCEESGFAGVEGLSAGTSVKKTSVTKPRVAGEDALAAPFASYAPVGEGLLSRIEPGAIGSVAVLFALIGAIGYGGFSVLREIQRVEFAPVDQAPGVLAEIDTLSQSNTTELSANVGQAFVAPTADALDRLYRPKALETPVLTARDGPIAAIDPNSVGALIVPEAETLNTANALPEDTPSLPAPPQVLKPEAPDVMLFAVRPAWVRVATADGAILFEKVLDAGESYVLPQTDEEPLLRAGNSGSLYFSVRGKTYGPAGPGTSVAKNVALGVDVIVENYAEADPAADNVLSEILRAMADTPVVADESGPITQ